MERPRESTLQQMVNKPGNYRERSVVYEFWYGDSGEVTTEEPREFNLISLGSISGKIFIKSNPPGEGGGSYRVVTAETYIEEGAKKGRTTDTEWEDLGLGEEKEIKHDDFEIPLATLRGK